ncbi:MAG: 2'-5' RNA ligase family protein [Nakamurella sp.]
MHSVELVLDDKTDQQIRAQWSELAAAGLPSQARHTGATNRPHITLALAGTLDATDVVQLTVAATALPMPVTIGGLLIFGAHRFVLARLVIPSAALLDLQGAITQALAEPVDPHHTFAAGRWTPHVTLARRLSADQLAEALTVLGEVSALDGMASRARRWDMTAKVESWIGG